MVRRRLERGSASALVLVLVVLVGAVGWNYHRNSAAEAREVRPYRSYSEADLAALIEAYEAEEKSAGSRYDSTVGRRAEARNTGYFMGNLAELERVQAAGREHREARSDFAAARANLEGLKEEQARRPGERSRLRVFFRRAFSFGDGV